MLELQNRTEINKQLAVETFFPPFFSVLLPELGRPEYLRNCINSVHHYADLPIEVIVHDDGSGKDKQRFLFEELRDKVSTFVFNNGHNTGLARSFNRCRAMATSKYLVGMNTDTYMTSSFLSKMKTALDLPYVGSVNVVPRIEDGPGVYVAPDGTKISLRNNMGSCHCFGIRSEVWDAAGGWDENVQTTSSDGGFLGHVFQLGLFGVDVEGTVVNEMWPIAEDGKVNGPGSNAAYVSAADFVRGDNNVPPIFKMSGDLHDQLCQVRKHMIWLGVNTFIHENKYYPFWYNSHFQCPVFGDMSPRVGKVDWDKAREYGFGHERWRDRMIQDFKLEA